MKKGDNIPEVAVTPDKYLPHRYAGASGDFNPIHIDNEFAQQVGLPRNILHGLYSMAQVARANAAAAGGDPRSLQRLKVQFRGMGVPESRSRSPARCARRATARYRGHRGRAGHEQDHPQREAS